MLRKGINGMGGKTVPGYQSARPLCIDQGGSSLYVLRYIVNKVAGKGEWVERDSHTDKKKAMEPFRSTQARKVRKKMKNLPVSLHSLRPCSPNKTSISILSPLCTQR